MSVATKASAASKVAVASAASEVAVVSKAPVKPKASSRAPTSKGSKALPSSGKQQNEVMTKTNASRRVTPCTAFHVAILMFLIIT